ncbi:MAG: BlaI/MecI/CopY family transcriptional regulator [Planctomycetes bacterium]|nr:BlaI/MecI/CopY family transcriptional regulator [Planctomycetota bacterium]
MSRSEKIVFRKLDLKRLGLRCVLGELETSVLEKLWGNKDVSVREVMVALRKERDYAYTTVMTTMNRLWDKGILSRRKEGQTYLYTPALSKEGLVQAYVRKVFECIAPDLTSASVSYFVESLEEVSPEALDKLQKLLSEKAKPE